jgi:hypothetical protein
VIVAGDEVTTWNERVVVRADGFVVSSDGADSSDWFAIRSGIVLCRAVSFRMDGQSGAAASVVAVDAAPAPTPTETILPESVPVLEAASAPAEAPAPASVHQPAPEPEVVGDSDLDVGDTIDDVEPIDAEDFGPTVTELPDDAYDHLWGATVVKSVEEAAVRLDDDESSDEESASAAPPSAAPAAVPTPAPTPAPAAPAVESFTPPASSTSSSKEWTAPPPTGLIDRVPGFAGVGAAATDWNDQSTPVVPSPQASNESDHDGLTVTVSELEAMRRLESADDAATTDGPGRIVLATGDVVSLDRPVIVGRRPRAQRVQGDVLPHLVTVPSPEQDVSRSHLEVRVEGRHVLVVDLDTTNGSVLHRAGTPPLRLSPGEAVLVLNGDIVDIGDGVTLLFEDLP